MASLEERIGNVLHWDVSVEDKVHAVHFLIVQHLRTTANTSANSARDNSMSSRHGSLVFDLENRNVIRHDMALSLLARTPHPRSSGAYPPLCQAPFPHMMHPPPFVNGMMSGPPPAAGYPSPHFGPGYSYYIPPSAPPMEGSGRRGSRRPLRAHVGGSPNRHRRSRRQADGHPAEISFRRRPSTSSSAGSLVSDSRPAQREDSPPKARPSQGTRYKPVSDITYDDKEEAIQHVNDEFGTCPLGGVVKLKQYSHNIYVCTMNCFDPDCPQSDCERCHLRIQLAIGRKKTDSSSSQQPRYLWKVPNYESSRLASRHAERRPGDLTFDDVEPPRLPAGDSTSV